MKTSLVTGGAGFIGSHVARELIALGHQVIVVDDLSGGNKTNVPDQATFIEGDITDHIRLAQVFTENKIDYIYHLAAYAAEGLSHFIKRHNYNTNLVGSINLINEAIKHEIKCFVFISSIAVYGSQRPPMQEIMTPKPMDPYGIAKFAVEQELEVSREMFGLDYIIFRPHNVYGEYQNIADKYRNVIAIFMHQVLHGQPLSIFGDGSQTRAFSYVGDVAPVIARSVGDTKAYNEVFNIGSDEEITIQQLAQFVMETMESVSEINYLDARHEAQHAHADHTKLQQYFDLPVPTTIQEGLLQMAYWAKNTTHQPIQQAFDQLEVVKNLPSFWK